MYLSEIYIEVIYISIFQIFNTSSISVLDFMRQCKLEVISFLATIMALTKIKYLIVLDVVWIYAKKQFLHWIWMLNSLMMSEDNASKPMSSFSFYPPRLLRSGKWKLTENVKMQLIKMSKIVQPHKCYPVALVFHLDITEHKNETCNCNLWVLKERSWSRWSQGLHKIHTRCKVRRQGTIGVSWARAGFMWI